MSFSFCIRTTRSFQTPPRIQPAKHTQELPEKSTWFSRLGAGLAASSLSLIPYGYDAYYNEGSTPEEIQARAIGKLVVAGFVSAVGAYFTETKKDAALVGFTWAAASIVNQSVSGDSKFSQDIQQVSQKIKTAVEESPYTQGIVQRVGNTSLWIAQKTSNYIPSFLSGSALNEAVSG